MMKTKQAQFTSQDIGCIIDGSATEDKNNQATIEEVMSLQDILRFAKVWTNEDREINAVDRAFLNERWPKVNALLTKLENSVSIRTPKVGHKEKHENK